MLDYKSDFLDSAVALYESSPALVCFLDNGLHIVWRNRKAEEKLPFLKYMDSMAMAMPGCDAKSIIAGLRSGRSYEERQCKLPIVNSSVRLEPLLDTEGVLGGILCWITDMDGQDLDQDAGALQIDKIVALFSNQFREPLTMLFSMLGSMSRKLGDGSFEHLDEYVASMTKNCYKLLRACINTTELARYTKGAMVLEKKRGDLCAFVENICRAASVITNLVDIPLVFEKDVDRLLMDFDAEKITRALLNLISNSCLFTREGNSITVRVQRQEEQAVVSVADKGAGIPEENIAKVFEPYFSFDTHRYAKSKAGIGLTIVKHIVSQHGGTIALHTKYQEGTTIAFTIPIATSEEVEGMVESNAAAYITDRFSPVYIELADVQVNPLK